MMMMSTHLALWLVLVALAVAQDQGCGNGKLGPDGCCVCFVGWADDGDSPCAQCAEGYVYDKASGVCGNGRDLSDCKDEAAWPLFGCSVDGEVIGRCSKDGFGRSVFPCKCNGESCAAAAASKQSRAGRCSPAGVRMYATYPNEPTLIKGGGSPFSLTLVGCDLSESDVFAVIPAYTSDLTTETKCSELPDHPTANIEDMCQYEGEAVVLGSGGEDSAVLEANTSTIFGDAMLCPTGFVLSGLKHTAQGGGMSELSYYPISMQDSSAFAGSADARAKQAGERESFFRVCTRSASLSRSGESTFVWLETANHDSGVDKRDFTFKVSHSLDINELAKGAGEDLEDGVACCDGLKIGSLCLPLWVFLLLWFLMALCLCGMGYTLHKNNQEIEAAKNNEKYEKFNVDSEMSHMAAKRDDDDDI